MTQQPKNQAPKNTQQAKASSKKGISPPLIVGGVLGLMILLIGAWFALSGNQNESTIAQPPATTAPPNTTESTPNDTARQATIPTSPTESGTEVPTIPNAPSGSNVAQSQIPVNPSVTSSPQANQIEVAVIPPFAVAAAATNNKTPVTVAAVSTGINPEEPLMSINGNPFKPLKLDKNAVTATQSPQPIVQKPAIPPKAPTPKPKAVTKKPVATTKPKVDSLGSRGGAIAVAPLPGTTTSIRPVKVTSVAIPKQVKPTTKKPTTAKTNSKTPTKTTTKKPVSTPKVTPKVTLSAPKKPTTSSLGGVMPTANIPGSGSSFSKKTQPKVMKPPVAGMNAPGNNTTTKPSQNTKTSIPTASSTKPQVISELSQMPEEIQQPTGPTKLETYITNNEMALNGVVLGTINTAIFRSKGGFVVLTSGQKIPDTEILVKEVTATTATLELATDAEPLKETLKLDGES